MPFAQSIGRLVEPLEGRIWPAEEIRSEIAGRTAHFAAQGMGSGDRVFITFGNDGDFFLDLLAIWARGACAVPLDPRLTDFEVENLAKSAQPRFILFKADIGGELTRRLTALDMDFIRSDEPRKPAPAAAPAVVLPDSEALILFTSGSTGAPKGVVHSHRSLLAQWVCLRQALDPALFQRSLCLLPTHFGHGLICNSLFPWLSGKDLYVLPSFTPDVIMRLGRIVDDHDITFLSSVPAVWQIALKLAAPPKKNSLRQVFCGSAPLTEHLWRQIQDWCDTSHVANSYGITETASWIAGTTMPGFVPEDGLIGIPWGSTIKILNESSEDAPGNDRGNAHGDIVGSSWSNAPIDLLDGCQPHQEGQIWVKSPAVMKGYLDREDLTAAALRQGWFATGDIGLLDSRGCLHLRGRERDEINKGGMKIYPIDIEAVAERFPGVSDCCCFAYDAPPYGQNVGVALVLAEAEIGIVAELYRWMTEHLAEHKMPARWFAVDHIARSSRGKVNRASVAAACSALTPLDITKLVTR